MIDDRMATIHYPMRPADNQPNRAIQWLVAAALLLIAVLSGAWLGGILSGLLTRNAHHLAAPVGGAVTRW